MFTEEQMDDIDTFLKNKKSIEGNIIWTRDNEKSSYIAKFPLSHNGNLIIDFDFSATANLSGKPELRGGTLKMLHSPKNSKEKILVCRMHVFPGNYHTNPRIPNLDVSGWRLVPRKTRFYSWEDMKLLNSKSHISQDKHIARNIENINNLEESIQYFLDYTNVSGLINLPEYDITLL